MSLRDIFRPSLARRRAALAEKLFVVLYANRDVAETADDHEIARWCLDSATVFLDVAERRAIEFRSPDSLPRIFGEEAIDG